MMNLILILPLVSVSSGYNQVVSNGVQAVLVAGDVEGGGRLPRPSFQVQGEALIAVYKHVNNTLW